MTRPTDIRIGTSGWHYDHWLGPFYPPQTRAQNFLGYYARHFRRVEINNDDALATWARRMRSWSAEGVRGYCYFDNDEQGCAPAHALTLGRLVSFA